MSEPQTAPPVARRSLPFVLYPIATPIAAIVQLWAVSVVPFSVLVRPVFVAIVISVAIIAVATLIAGDRHRGGIAAWAVLVGLTVDDIRATALLSAVAVIVLVAARATRARPWRRWPLVSRAMNALAAILLLAVVIGAFQGGAIQAAVEDLRLNVTRPAAATDHRPNAPDIFVILLDGYPGAVAAASEPSFDAEAFPDALRQRGFDVAANSRSNYLITRLTLPAVFMHQHLPDVPDLRPSTAAQDANALRELTDGGAALTFLGEAGYERIAVASGYSHIGPNRVDRRVIPPQVEEFELALLHTDGVGELLDIITPDLSSSQKRDRIADTFAAWTSIAGETHDRPRFVFVHVPAPHQPWVSDADGKPVLGASRMGDFNPAVTDVPAGRRMYFDYATFIAEQTIEAIDATVERSPEPPVIFLFSDHGPDIVFDSSDPFGSDPNERTSNLMAVLAPGHPDLIPDDATAVNIFPYIFNAYLDGDLPIQPNTLWGWRTNSSLLDFVEIDPLSWGPKQ